MKTSLKYATPTFALAVAGAIVAQVAGWIAVDEVTMETALAVFASVGLIITAAADYTTHLRHHAELGRVGVHQSQR